MSIALDSERHEEAPVLFTGDAREHGRQLVFVSSERAVLKSQLAAIGRLADRDQDVWKLPRELTERAELVRDQT